MLTATVFACIIFFIVLSLTRDRLREHWLAFIFCGLLIWVRPEVGFFVTLFTGALYGIPLVLRFLPKGILCRASCRVTSSHGRSIYRGNPLLFEQPSHNPQPADPGIRPAPPAHRIRTLRSRGPLPIQEVTNNMDMVNQTSGLGAGETLVRVYEIISHAIFRSFSFDNLVQGFSGVMFFPVNGNIGFAIMCPLVVIALVALILLV